MQNNIERINDSLLGNVEYLLSELGEEINKPLSNNKEYRCRGKGSLAVSRLKPVYYDFENNNGGDLISFISQKFGFQFKESLIWAKEFLRSYGGGYYEQ